MPETPFFFPNGSYNLFGVLHEPESSPNQDGFVFCSPFGEEKLWTHRVYVNFARELASRGYPVLRFDYMGHGDSDGDFETSSIETRLSDITCAIKELRSKARSTERIGLLGLRLGGTLAAMTAEEAPDINPLILWDPILDGKAYMRELFRINLATQSAVYREIKYNTEALIQMMRDGVPVNVEGYEIGWPLYEQLEQLCLLDGRKKYLGKTLLVQIVRKPGKISDKIKNLHGLYAKCTVEEVVEEPFWKEIRYYYPRAENLYRTTLDWLEKN